MIMLIGVILAVLVGLVCLFLAGNMAHVIGFIIGSAIIITLSFEVGLLIVAVTYIGLLIVTFEAWNSNV